MDAIDRPLLAALVLASTLSPLGSTSVAVTLPDIARALGASVPDVTRWLVGSYLVASVVLQSPGGRLGDLLGHRRALRLGQLAVAAGTCLCVSATSLPMLVVGRVLAAAGGAVVVPSALALARIAVAEHRRARALGAFGAAMGLAAAVGPVLGGELTAAFGWRAALALPLALVALSAALASRSATRIPDAPAAPRRFDLVGSALLGVALALLVGGLRDGDPGVLAAAAVTSGAFVWWEGRVADPVLDPGLFRTASFTRGALVVGLANMAAYATVFHAPAWLAHTRGASASDTGRALLALVLSSVAATPVGARLSERLGDRAVTVAGLLVAASGTAWLRAADSLASSLPCLCLVGLGSGLVSAPAQTVASLDVPVDRAGMAAGALSTLRYLGGVAGLAVLGLAARHGDHAAQHRLTMTALTAPLLVGAALALGFPATRRATGVHDASA